MCCVYGRLVFCLKSGGEVGYVGSYVSGLFADSKPEILRSILLKLLGSNGNALDGYYETYVVLEALACCELFGDIKNGDFLDGLINDYETAALGLLHSAVGSYGSSNGYGHTECDAFLKGILLELVAVVTALAVNVSEEEVVSGIACALSVDTDNDTCNGNGCALFSRHIVLEGGNFKFRNYAIVRNGSSRSVGSSNCTDDLIVNSLKRELVNLDGPLGATLNCSDLIAVSCPRNHVLVETDHYLTEHLIVNRGNRLCVLILSVKECSS